MATKQKAVLRNLRKENLELKQQIVQLANQHDANNRAHQMALASIKSAQEKLATMEMDRIRWHARERRLAHTILCLRESLRRALEIQDNLEIGMSGGEIGAKQVSDHQNGMRL